LPALGMARASAREAVCLANARSLQQAATAYATDNAGQYPRTRFDPSIDGGANFGTHTLASPFDPTMDANAVGAAMWLLLRERYVQSPAVFASPSAPYEPLPEGIDARAYSSFPPAPISRDNRRGLHF